MSYSGGGSNQTSQARRNTLGSMRDTPTGQVWRKMHGSKQSQYNPLISWGDAIARRLQQQAKSGSWERGPGGVEGFRNAGRGQMVNTSGNRLF